jgi:hypothetical protein
MSAPGKTVRAVHPPEPAADRRYILPFSELTLESVPEVGGKNASLGELLASLGPEGVVVPDGFALTAAAFRLHLAEAGLDRSIYGELDRVDPADLAALTATARSIRERISAAPLPAVVRAGLAEAYRTLSRASGEDATDVAVRSSATAEDLPRSQGSRRHISTWWVSPPSTPRCAPAWHRSSPSGRSCTVGSTAMRTATWRSPSVFRRWFGATWGRPG